MGKVRANKGKGNMKTNTNKKTALVMVDKKPTRKGGAIIGEQQSHTNVENLEEIGEIVGLR